MPRSAEHLFVQSGGLNSPNLLVYFYFILFFSVKKFEGVGWML